MPLDFFETGILFNAPLLVFYVPGSGKRFEVISGVTAEDIATYIKSHWLDTTTIRQVNTDPFKEGEGVDP